MINPIHSQGARRQVAVTPSDSADLATLYPLFLTCTTAGNITCTDNQGNDYVAYMVVGQQHPFSPKRIKATGTAAAGIVAHYAE